MQVRVGLGFGSEVEVGLRLEYGLGLEYLRSR